MTEAEILLDIKKRHSPLHAVSAQLANVMDAVNKAQKACYANGLTAEINAVGEALIAAHEKLETMWKAGK